MSTSKRLLPKLIANYAGSRAFAPRTRIALKNLGYDMVPATTRGRFDDVSWKPALRVVDERHLDRLPSPAQDSTTPIVLLTGLRPLSIQDPRIAGRVQRPAGLASLYRVFQFALEETPRSTPRVRTQLSARAVRADRRVVGAVISLSADGCLFQTHEDVAEGARMNLQFALPMVGVVSTRAECVRHEGDALGLVFSDAPPHTRTTIGEFVSQRLAAL